MNRKRNLGRLASLAVAIVAVLAGAKDPRTRRFLEAVL
jgi:hypothetical protein